MAQKIAIVTGSNKGIGYGIVKSLCEKYDGVIYLTSRDVERGNLAVKELQTLGLKYNYHQLDIDDQKSVDQFRDYIKEKYEGIDILINNAGIAFKVSSKAPFAEQVRETVKTNYFGTLRVSEALFPLLKPYARVVNVSSSCGHLSRIPSAELKSKFSDSNLTEEQLSALMNDFINSANAKTNVKDGWGTSAYNVSKVGVSALTFIQQRNFNNDSRAGIVVNSVHPGYVDTDMTSHMGDWTIEQGIDAPLFLALLPKDTNIKGCYVWKDRSVVDWTAPDPPARF